jgi:hypothetical protein
VKKRFQAFAFICALYRYIQGQLSQLANALQTDRDAFASGTTYSVLSNAFSGPLPYAMYSVGLYKLSSVYPWL